MRIQKYADTVWSVTISTDTQSSSSRLCPPLLLLFLPTPYFNAFFAVRVWSARRPNTYNIHTYVHNLHALYICVQNIEYQETLNRLYGNSLISTPTPSLSLYRHIVYIVRTKL